MKIILSLLCGVAVTTLGQSTTNLVPNPSARGYLGKADNQWSGVHSESFVQDGTNLMSELDGLNTVLSAAIGARVVTNGGFDLLSTANGRSLTNLQAQRVFNVVHYGATPSDLTNNGDHLAIQSAIWAAGDAGGGVVYLPPGNYYCTQTNYTNLTSENHESTIVFRSEDNHVTVRADQLGTVLWTWEDLTGSPAVMNGIGSGDSYGTPWNGATNVTFENIVFDFGTNRNDYLWDGTQVYNAGPWTFRNCVFRNTARGDAIDTGCTVLTVANCQFEDIVGTAIHPSSNGSVLGFVSECSLRNVSGTDLNGYAVECAGGRTWFQNIVMTNCVQMIYQFGAANSHWDNLYATLPSGSNGSNIVATAGTMTFSGKNHFVALGAPTADAACVFFLSNVTARLGGLYVVAKPAIRAKDMVSLTIDPDCHFLNAFYSTVTPTVWLDNCDYARVGGYYGGSGQIGLIFTNGASDSAVIENAVFNSLTIKVYDAGTNKLFNGLLMRGGCSVQLPVATATLNTFKDIVSRTSSAWQLYGASNLFENCSLSMLTLYNSGCVSNTFLNTSIGTFAISGSTSGTKQIWNGWNSTNNVQFITGTSIIVDAAAFTTNAASPAVDLRFGSQTHTLTADWTATAVNYVDTAQSQTATVLFIGDASTSYDVLVPASWFTTDGLNTWTVTNGQRGILTVNVYAGASTNAAFRNLW